MTRILLVTSFFPPEHYGGYELLCADFAANLMDAGQEVAVLTSDHRVASARERTHPDVRIERRLKLYFDDGAPRACGPIRALAKERHNCRVVREMLQSFRPEVASIWHLGALSMSIPHLIASSGLPVQFTVYDDWLLYGPEMDSWVSYATAHRRPARLAARVARVPPVDSYDLGHSGHFDFCSRFAERRSSRASRYQLKSSSVIMGGVNRRLFPPRSSSVNAHPGPWRILCPGRLDPRKGQAILIESLAHLAFPVDLTLAGWGDPTYQAQLAEQAGDLGLSESLRFVRADREELSQLYQQADVVVFPVTWDEPFGLVPAEAMSSGTPVVATATGGAAEYLVHEGNCLVVEPGDARGLADALSRLHLDPDLGQRLVAGGFETAAELDFDRLAEKLAQSLGRVREERRRRNGTSISR